MQHRQRVRAFHLIIEVHKQSLYRPPTLTLYTKLVIYILAETTVSRERRNNDD